MATVKCKACERHVSEHFIDKDTNICWDCENGKLVIYRDGTSFINDPTYLPEENHWQNQ